MPRRGARYGQPNAGNWFSRRAIFSYTAFGYILLLICDPPTLKSDGQVPPRHKAERAMHSSDKPVPPCPWPNGLAWKNRIHP